jgi:hypothetical protein
MKAEMERHHGTLFIPKAWEERSRKITGELMPARGPADTLEGEMLRAVNKIVYRYYNDGDYWYQGYGCETAGPAAAFLSDVHVIDRDVSFLTLVNDSDGRTGNSYEIALFALLQAVVKHVEAKNLRNDLTPNPELDEPLDSWTPNLKKRKWDMLQYDAKYEPEYEDDWYDDPYEDDFEE